MKLRRFFSEGLHGTLNRNDRGVALPMVLMVFLVGIALIGAFLVAVVGSATVSDRTRSNIQAQAAADGGLSAAQVHWLDDPCSYADHPLVSDSPSYLVSVTCNQEGDEATITSLGRASDGATHTVEAIYALDRQALTPSGGFADAVLTAGGAGTETTLNQMFFSTEGEAPNIRVNGNLDCDVSIPGDIYVKGNVYLNQGCDVSGNVYANGHVGINNGVTVAGSVFSLGEGPLPTKENERTISGTIQGDYHTAGNLEIGYWGTIRGDVIAAGTGTHSIKGRQIGLPSANSTVTVGGPVKLDQWDVRLYGDLLASGTVTLSGGVTITGEVVTDKTITVPSNSSVGLKVKRKVDIPSGPSMPDFPDTIHFEVTQNEWERADFEYVVIPSSECDSWNSSAATGWASLSSREDPIVVDARACEELTTNFGIPQNLELQTDVVLIAKKYNLTGLSVKSSAETTPRMWFIASDSSQNSTINGAKILPNIHALMFSEGSISLNGGATWRGLMYSASSTVVHGGYSSFVFLPVGISGIDFMNDGNGSENGNGDDKVTLGDLLSQRDVFS